MPATHPSPQQLTAFLHGRLSPAEQSSVEEHVGECAECCRRLERVGDDTLGLLARDAAHSTRVISRDDSDPATGRDAAPTVGTVEVPAELRDHPRYRVVKVVGTGGMGTVYQAQHRVMDRVVALKVISPRLIADPRVLQRFEQEVRAAARLTHANIVTAFDAEQAGGLHFLVMEYVDGTSLARLVEQKGPLPVSEACQYIGQAALGLQHAFKKGMVHRDIKPHNLMLTRRGQVKILDFGLARLVRDQSPDALPAAASGKAGLTLAGSVLGTPDFIAPEQVRDSRTADIRADIYSLGCTLYYLLAGRTPFQGDLRTKLQAHCDTVPDSLFLLRSGLPDDLLAIVEKMMAKDPANRYQTPAEVAKALEPFARAERTSSPDDATVALSSVRAAAVETTVADAEPALPPRRRASRIGKRRGGGHWNIRTLVLAGGALAAIVIVGFVAALWRPWSGFTSTTDNVASDLRPAGKPGSPAGARSPVPAANRPLSDVPTVLMILPHDEFWERDYYPVRKRLEQGNRVRVEVASSQKTPATSNFGRSEPVDHLLADISPENYGAVVFVGSARFIEYESGADQLDARRVVDALIAKDRIVASICKGTVVPAKLGVLKGRRAAQNKYLKGTAPDHVLKQMAAWVWTKEADPVIDGPFITARDVDDDKVATRFADAILAKLGTVPQPSAAGR